MKKIKIKGALANLSPSVPMLVALVGAVLLLPLRIWQLAANTDLQTGFFIERNAFVYVFFILAVLTSVAVLLLSYLCGKMPNGELAQVSRPISGVFALLLGVAFGYESLQSFAVLMQEASNAGLSLYESSVANGSFRTFLCSVFGAVAAIAFVLLFVACLNGKYNWLKFPAVLFLGAPLWGILKVISYFTYTISYLVAAELFCEMYAAICLMLFLFTLARFYTQTSVEDGSWTVVASGLLSALFCALASVPRIVMILAGQGAVQGFDVNLIFATGTVFSVISVLSFVRTGVFAKETSETEVAAEVEDKEIPVEPFNVE